MGWYRLFIGLLCIGLKQLSFFEDNIVLWCYIFGVQKGLIVFRGKKKKKKEQNDMIGFCLIKKMELSQTYKKNGSI